MKMLPRMFVSAMLLVLYRYPFMLGMYDYHRIDYLESGRCCYVNFFVSLTFHGFLFIARQLRGTFSGVYCNYCRQPVSYWIDDER